MQIYKNKEKREKLINIEEMNNDTKNYNNMSCQNLLEITKGKKYNEIITTRPIHYINDKPSILNQRRVQQYDDPNLFNRKNVPKINSRKVVFIGMPEKRSKLLFYDNKNGLIFHNNSNVAITDKKINLNLKPLTKIKGKNEANKNQSTLINKNFSSVELRPKNTQPNQNNISMNDNNIIMHIKKNLNENKINPDDIKKIRNKSTKVKHDSENNEHKDNQNNSKTKEKPILRNKILSKQIIDATNSNITYSYDETKKKFQILSQREKAYFLLTQSKVLQLQERIIFSRASESLRSLIPIKELINSNELFLKEKLNKANLDLDLFNKNIEKPFSPSKTADISLNIIKKDDEEIFKNLLVSDQNIEENEKKYYHTYICLLYILLGEDLNKIQFENIDSNLLFDKLNKRGYLCFKDYLYDNFVKKKSELLNDYNRMNIFNELFGTLPDLIKYHGSIKSNKFICFSYFLIKEIQEYYNKKKQLVYIKDKTQSSIEDLKRKCSL